MKNYKPAENDIIRSYNGQPDNYSDGIVVAVDSRFATFVVLARVRNGSAVQVDADEISSAPLNGHSMFDDPFRPRIKKIGRVPEFLMTDAQATALIRFRAAREAIYPQQSWKVKNA